MKLRIMDIYHDSIVDGEGFRDVVFLNMCPHHCKGCHNPESWAYSNGTEVSINEVFETLKANRIADVTFSGGEPFLQCEALIALCKRIKTETTKTIWIYTGYDFTDLYLDPIKRELIHQIDVLVDGPFIQSLANKTLRFRGSSNQRIIDVQKTLEKGEIIIHHTQEGTQA